MKRFRLIIFWLHLACGLTAGLVIGIMSFTGVALAFEKETIAFAERDARRVTPPADAKPLPLDELLRKVRVARPDARVGALVISRDPGAAISLSGGGRGGGGGGPGGGAAAPSLYANPYTGEVREASSPRTSAFMRSMRSWHRWLGVEGEHRNIARMATGACNFAFLGLAITGLYLWWPRSWSRTAVRAIALFNVKLRGKARDFNWHNAIGLWSAPVLIVLTATALPMSYTWAGDLIYKLTGTPVPASSAGPGGGGGGAFGGGPTIEVPTPAPNTPLLSNDALLALVQKENPAWEQITLRLGGASAGGGRGDAGGPGGRGGGRGPRPESVPASSIPPAVTVTLKQSNSWPRTTTTTLSLDPCTGATIRRSGYAEQTGAQQVRSWTRFLHTGEALGWLGQLVAGLASFGGCVLVYTGFALAWHRFFGRPTAAP